MSLSVGTATGRMKDVEEQSNEDDDSSSNSCNINKDENGKQRNERNLDEQKDATQTKPSSRDTTQNDEGIEIDPYNNNKNGNDTESSSKDASLLEEMMGGLALSMLIFLIADLRLMSATGRIATKYETIAVESDMMLRDSAAILAGLEGPRVLESSVSAAAAPSSPSSSPSSSKHRAVRETGLSPAQMMAVVLIELKRTFDAQEAEGGDNSLLRDASETGPAPVNNRQSQGWGQGFSNFLAEKSRAKLPHESLHSLLKAYLHMIGSDLASNVPHIEARRSYLNFMSLRNLDGLDENDETAEPPLNQLALVHRRSSTAGNIKMSSRFASIKRNASEAVVMATSGGAVAKAAVQQIKDIRESMLIGETAKAQKEIKETTDALFKMGDANVSLRRKLTRSDAQRGLSSDELLTIMEKAVQSRVHGKLDFMTKFFRDGTISQLMVKSTARIFWVNDWYPVKDLTYAIAVDAEKKRVLVVFRGAITKQDWSKAVSFRLREHPNPIAEDYPGKSPMLDMHNGFHQYLLRIRKDTGTTKYDEIANTAHRFGLERIGSDYHLAITGHSLGAALSTVFGMFASADERFTRNGPIKIFTFGSPYVGGHYFADAFRHQEETGKVMYARFYNHNDAVAYFPANFGITKRGSKYRHVGIGIKIPPVPLLFFRKWKPSVYYVGGESCTKALFRAMGRSFLLRSPWPWRIARMHTLAELLQRLMDGIRTNYYEQTDFMLLEKPIEEVYEQVAGLSASKQRKMKEGRED